MESELVHTEDHRTLVLPMPSGLYQAQCSCAWKGEETTAIIASRQATDHPLKPDGFSGQVVHAIEHYSKDEAEFVAKSNRVNRQVTPTDTAVMKLRSAGYARYEAGDPTAAAIMYRETMIQIEQELVSLGKGYTATEAAKVTPMIEVRTVVKEVPALPAPLKKGVRGLIQQAARRLS